MPVGLFSEHDFPAEKKGRCHKILLTAHAHILNPAGEVLNHVGDLPVLLAALFVEQFDDLQVLERFDASDSDKEAFVSHKRQFGKKRLQTLSMFVTAGQKTIPFLELDNTGLEQLM